MGQKRERVSASLFLKGNKCVEKKSGWNSWKVRGGDGWTVRQGIMSRVTEDGRKTRTNFVQ